MSHKPTDRRTFLRVGLLTATAIPLAGLDLGLARSARAQDMEDLADLPRAEDGHAFDYVNDVADAADDEFYEEGSVCANCVFWTGEVEDGWGGCQHPDFIDVLVNENGWCSAYISAEA